MWYAVSIIVGVLVGWYTAKLTEKLPDWVHIGGTFTAIVISGAVLAVIEKFLP